MNVVLTIAPFTGAVLAWLWLIQYAKPEPVVQLRPRIRYLVDLARYADEAERISLAMASLGASARAATETTREFGRAVAKAQEAAQRLQDVP